MRLWTLHPGYLDRVGLVAAWREALLAQRVLQGGTRGYRHHPQLIRFRQQSDPMVAIGRYLSALEDEAASRGYRFDREKIVAVGECGLIACTEGQLEFEWTHLMGKLQHRDPARYQRLQVIERPESHPLFVARPGVRAEWEIGGE
jgi:hypothetical protein